MKGYEVLSATGYNHASIFFTRITFYIFFSPIKMILKSGTIMLKPDVFQNNVISLLLILFAYDIF